MEKDAKSTDADAHLTQKVYQSAIRMLARREFSEREMLHKLSQKFAGARQNIIPEVVARLRNKQLLSDERFTEMLVRSRVAKGYGPAYIQQELLSKGISQALIKNKLEGLDVNWLHQAEALVKRHHPQYGASQQAWQRAAGYLQRRGYAADIIRRVLGDLPSDCPPDNLSPTPFINS